MKTIRFWLAACSLLLLTQNIFAVVVGSVQVTIQPDTVVNAGAQWQLDNGSLQNSGVILSNISASSHTISFTAVSNWVTPADLMITVTNGQTNFVTVSYAVDFTYITNADQATLTITGPNTAGGPITIPSTINGLPVTAIGSNAFQNAFGITSLVLPDSVLNIDSNAFNYCGGLTNVTWSAGLTNIGYGAFAQDPLEEVTFGTNIRSIGGEAFAFTLITNVTIPSAITNLGDGVFENCGQLLTATLGSNLYSTGNSTFNSCSSLTNVTIGPGVGRIGTNAFASTHLMSVTIPGSVVSIDDQAFEDCFYLSNFSIATGVSNIGYEAFYDDNVLQSIVIPGSVTNIGSSAFAYCGHATNLSLSEGLQYIGDQAFYSCSNLDNDLEIPDSTISIGAAAFGYCYGFKALSLAHVQSIGAAAFNVCTNLTSVIIPGSVTNFGSSIFTGGSSLTNVVFESGNPLVAASMFAGDTHLVSATFSDTTADIGADAFAGCSSLASIIFPASITNIEDSAFGGCSAVRSIYFEGNAPTVGGSPFGGVFATGFYFPGTTGWSNTLGGLSVALLAPPTGSAQVTVAPSGVVSNGAFFQIDGGSNQTSGSIVSNLSYGLHFVTFSDITGYVTPEFQVISVFPDSNTVLNATYVLTPGSLQVTLGPSGALAAGAAWKVNGGASQASGATVASVPQGTNTISFITIPGWTTPAPQLVNIAGGQTLSVSYLYTPAVSSGNGIVLLTNGAGSIQTKSWPATLVVGKNYTVKAVADAGNLFVNWIGGTVPPYSVLSTSASYTFTMQSNLLLEANFVTNLAAAGAGTYAGLFAPTNEVRGQSNSGAFNFTLTAAGALSGKLFLGSQTIALSGKVAADGSATITSVRKGLNSLVTTLQLDLADRAVNGTVSDGIFNAELNGYLDPFSSKHTTSYAGKYTLVIPGSDDPTIAPGGTSYGTVTVSAAGAVSFSGSLADGTAVSQSSVVSAGGNWPMYIPLYSGKGSLWSWNYFTNRSISNIAYGSWINTTNAAKTASYRAGFTNQAMVASGSIYSATNIPLLALTNGVVLLDGGGLPFSITNEIVLNTANKILFTNSALDTNKLALTINKTTGIITGAFADPAHPKKTVKVGGVLLQNQTNAQGYFLYTNQSGTLLLSPEQ